MAIIVLIVTGLLIIMAGLGLVYFCYRLITTKRGKYVKFDEEKGIELAKTGGVLAKIDEIPEEEFRSTEGSTNKKQQKGASTAETPSEFSDKANSKRISIVNISIDLNRNGDFTGAVKSNY